MSLVVDASVTVAWCLKDENSEFARRVLDRVVQTTAVAPPIWVVEVANALLVAERRRRLSSDETLELIAVLNELPIRIDESQQNPLSGKIVSLARRFGLSTYDAAYLELAQRTRMTLATLDDGLRRAAGRAKVLLFRV